MRRSRLLAASVAVAMSTTGTGASPLDWPLEDNAIALHCAAVLSAYGRAFELASELAGTEPVPFGGLPAPLVQEAGGDARLGDIAARAEGFLRHAESVARTAFYPRLIGDGTPYLADDGRELVIAVQSCVDRYAF